MTGRARASTRAALLLCAVLLVPACNGSSDGKSGSGGGAPPDPPVLAGPFQLPPGAVGAPYTEKIDASGHEPLSWSVSAGTLPQGLLLGSDGIVTGTPVSPGVSLFDVTVANDDGADTRTFTLTIAGFAVNTPESEPNGTAATADPLAVGAYGTGNLMMAGDVDFWAFQAFSGQDVRIEVFGLRIDQAAWNAASNRPVPAVFGPGATAPMMSGAPAAFVNGDLDLPALRIVESGTHILRIAGQSATNAGGSYAVRVVPLALPNAQAEAEPSISTGINDSASLAQPISPGHVRGYHTDGEFDYYSFQVVAPTIVSFTMTAYRQGLPGAAMTPYDPTIDLLAANGVDVLRSNDDSNSLDSALAFHVATPGTYFVRVGEYAFNTTSGPYLLEYRAIPAGVATESEPNNTPATADALEYGDAVAGTIAAGDPADYFSVQGSAGDIVHIHYLEGVAYQGAPVNGTASLTLFGADGTTQLPFAAVGFSQRIVRAILQSSGTFYVRLLASAPAPYSIAVTLVSPAAVELEPNGPGAQNSLPTTNFVSGTVSVAGDVDGYAFGAQAGEVVVLSVFAGAGPSTEVSGFGSLLAPLLSVETLQGSTLATATSSLVPPIPSLAQGIASPAARLELVFVAPQNGVYVARMTSASGTGSTSHHYVIQKR